MIRLRRLSRLIYSGSDGECDGHSGVPMPARAARAAGSRRGHAKPDAGKSPLNPSASLSLPPLPVPVSPAHQGLAACLGWAEHPGLPKPKLGPGSPEAGQTQLASLAKKSQSAFNVENTLAIEGSPAIGQKHTGRPEAACLRVLSVESSNSEVCRFHRTDRSPHCVFAEMAANGFPERNFGASTLGVVPLGLGWGYAWFIRPQPPSDTGARERLDRNLKRRDGADRWQMAVCRRRT